MTPPPDVRVGSGLDVHPFTDEQRPLILAGAEIPHGRGLAGHSDADVVAHAVADALLGAGGLGDLGDRFGTDAPERAGAHSMGMLSEVVADLRNAGWRVGNVDLTVVAQEPRLAPHRGAMVDNLAATLETGAVSVKFTTTDHLGAIGRAEGVACWAVVLVWAEP